VLRREWKTGDVIDLDLPMPIRRIEANPAIAADRGRVALERGPITFAAEAVDSPTHKVRNVLLPDSAKLTARFRPDLLHGVEVLEGNAVYLAYDAGGKLVRTQEKFTAIPYFAWANRGKDEMLVWIPDTETAAKPAPWPTLAMLSKVSASTGAGKITAEGIEHDPEAVNDGDEPASSADPASYFDWWPEKGKTEWLEYTFPKTATVSKVQLYWYDDGGRARVPASWRVLYLDGQVWKPVRNSGPSGVKKNQYNVVAFEPIRSNALRVEVTMQPGFSAGVQKWKVE